MSLSKLLYNIALSTKCVDDICYHSLYRKTSDMATRQEWRAKKGQIRRLFNLVLLEYHTHQRISDEYLKKLFDTEDVKGWQDRNHAMIMYLQTQDIQTVQDAYDCLVESLSK